MGRDIRLWIEILCGPIAWFISLCASFALAPWACALGWKPVLLVIPSIALLVTACSGLLAWNDWRLLGREFPGEAGGAVARSRAMASGGFLLSGFFVIVIGAQIVGPAILSACA